MPDFGYITNTLIQPKVKGATGNRYYCPYAVNNGSITNPGTALVINTIYAYPFVVDEILNIDLVVLKNQTAIASAEARVGLYKDNGSLYPGELVTEFTSASTFDMSSTGIKTKSVSGITMYPGITYWLTIVSGHAIQITHLSTFAVIPILGFSPIGLTAGNGNNSYTIGHTFGALPNPMTSGGAINAASLLFPIYLRYI